ncbi:ATP-grasp domain-containing protein [Aurantiacibacter spongiae]|uniref:ATP-grasp domain-containing protein n=1 Tax=Aurantiacibacter spongiae TaxID=2488860 RepID=A0A3N5CVB0_9SPHN|nr:ATP-grasp domain-containing protein [Aurantiacibacter spongiae]
MTVLVTGGGAVLGQGIIKSLKASSLDARIIVADPNPLSVGLYWGDERAALPLASDASYGDAVRALLTRYRPDVVLVGTDVELPFFAAEREALERAFETKVLVSDPCVVAIADDKYATFRFMRDAGFHPPASALPENGEDMARLIEDVGFPLVVKPRIGARAVGVSVVRDRQALADALEGREGLVVQECVGTDATEYTAGTLSFDGETRASIVLRRDLRDGNTHRAFHEPDEALDTQVRAFADALQPYGPANFQFRTDADGRARVFEINARFSGTTPMRAMMGFNEVEMCIHHLLSGRTVEQPAIRPGTVLRYLDEIFVPADTDTEPAQCAVSR